jgi:N-acetylmuramoyl-L-alanine amidase
MEIPVNFSRTRPMPIDYEVQQGDCIGNIAFSHGFHWTTIWNHPQNAALKSQRGDPNLLLPGDKVYIPDLDLKQQSCATDQRHTFELKGVPAYLQLRLIEEDKESDPTASPAVAGDDQYQDPDFQADARKHKPRANVPYLLYIDGVLAKSANSDGSGFIKIPMYPGAQNGRLMLFPGTPKEEVHSLQLGGMDPLDEIPGMKKRLNNLGFACDDGDGATPEFEAALALFQERFGLPITGKPDSATRSRLKQEHGG